MKQLYTLLIILLLVQISNSQESEPNDTPAQAQDLLFNVEINGDISTTDLNDWYRFELNQAGLFELDIRKAEGNIIFWVYLQDGEMENEPLINQVRMFNTDTLITLRHKLLEGVYYIHVGTATTLIPYQLLGRFEPTFWENDPEPNNVDSLALPIEPNGEVSGTILYYGAGEGNDLQDWYKLELTEAGLLELEMQKKVVLNSEFTVYLKDGEKEGFPVIDQYRLFANDTLHTLSHKLLKGIYFVHLAGPVLPNNYRIKSTFTPPAWADDVESNDADSLALTMEPNGVVSGTLVYYGAGEGYDNQDWYKLELTEGGLLELEIEKNVLADSEFTVILKDAEKEGYPNIKSYRLFHGDYLYTLRQDLLEGSYFVHIAGPYRANNYQIRSTFTPPAWPEDIEPNGDTTLATLITLTDSITGNLRSYEAGAGYDNQDWYEFEITEEGLATFKIQKENNNAIIWMYLTDPGQVGNPVIKSIRLFVDAFSGQFKQYFIPGRYFLLLTDASRDVGYIIKPTFTPQPVADFSFDLINTTFSFQNLSNYGDSYLWEFGDAEMSEAVHPLHQYSLPDNYNVCLTVTNEAGQNKSCKDLIVYGLSRISPTYGGNIDDVLITAYGGGLDTFYTIQLMKNEQIFASAENTIKTGKNNISGQLALRGIPTGTYDIRVQKNNNPSYLLTDAFHVAKGKSADPWVRIIGRDRILFNTWSNYTVELGNHGNVDAKVVPVWLLFEETDSIDIELEYNEISLNNFSPTFDDGKMPYIEVDTLAGFPFKARAYSFFAPRIPFNENIFLPLKIKTNKDIRILSWAETPYFPSPIEEDKNEFEEDKSECMAQAISEAAEESNEVAPYECALLLTHALMTEFLNAIGRTNEEEEEEPGKTQIISFPEMVSAIIQECGSIENKEDRQTLALFMAQYYLYFYTVASATAQKIYARPNPSSANINRSICLIKNEPKNPNKKPIKSVFNLDPNEKVGPSGFSEMNFFNKLGNISYRIYYENKNVATAPVHTLIISDQLDKEKYDLNSFSFGSFSIGDSIWYPAPGLKDYIGDFYLANLDVTARIHAKLDINTGKVTWLIRSLDPETLTDIEDPDVGFLPPNHLSPEGEGYVSFSIRALEGLNHNDKIQNEASIIFDANQPLITNTYSIKLDQLAPESIVNTLSAETQSNKFDVSWQGSDDDSGLAFFDIFYSINEDTFQLWQYHTIDTIATFVGEENTTYQFYSIAYDWVGNKEATPIDWDTEISITTPTQEVEYYNKRLSISPNPAKDQLVIKLTLDEQRKVEYYITNVLGVQKELVFKGQFPSGENNIQADLGSFPSGTYFLHAVIDGILISKKFILLE